LDLGKLKFGHLKSIESIKIADFHDLNEVQLSIKMGVSATVIFLKLCYVFSRYPIKGNPVINRCLA